MRGGEPLDSPHRGNDDADHTRMINDTEYTHKIDYPMGVEDTRKSKR